MILSFINVIILFICIYLEVHRFSSGSCVVNIMHLCVITFIYLLSRDWFASLLIRNFHNLFAALASYRFIDLYKQEQKNVTFCTAFSPLSCVFIEFILPIRMHQNCSMLHNSISMNTLQQGFWCEKVYKLYQKDISTKIDVDKARHRAIILCSLS